MEQRAHLYTLAGVCALPRAYLRTGNFPRTPIWRLCRNKGLHPLRRLRGYPCTPTKTVHPLARLYYFCGFYYPVREVIPIAIYHCNIGIVSRGKGKSAVAAAAYRSGEKITNEWDGMPHDYTRKRGVVHTEILLPPHAPPSFSDRATLTMCAGAVCCWTMANRASVCRPSAIRCSADTSGKRCCPQTGSYARILQPRRTPARNASCAVSPFPPAATAQNTVTAVRPMLPGAMQPSASAASGQRRGVSRFRGFKSLAASGFPDTLLECAGYSYGNCEKRL